MKTLIGLVVIIIIGSLAWFFLGGQTPTQVGTEDGVTGTMLEGSGEPDNDLVGGDAAPGDSMGDGLPSEDNDEGNVVEFTVEGGNFFFSPSTMTVNKGDTVRVTFKNIGGFHDFVIDEFSVATTQFSDPGEETVEFTADQVGTFSYYCSVGNHRAQGMEGILTVVE